MRRDFLHFYLLADNGTDAVLSCVQVNDDPSASDASQDGGRFLSVLPQRRSSNRLRPLVPPKRPGRTERRPTLYPLRPPDTHQLIYRYLSINSWWNLMMLPTHSVPGARNVVRKCSVPSFCPKPEPGTTHTPVLSSRRMQ